MNEIAKHIALFLREPSYRAEVRKWWSERPKEIDNAIGLLLIAITVSVLLIIR